MIGKVEQVLAYIKSLELGERVSVRQLAKVLGVSEGTAYKAVKLAKESGIVQSKPKSGTVRVEVPEQTERVRLSWLVDQLGFAVIAGERYQDSVVDRIVLADGSVEQFRQQLQCLEGTPICLTGDRPDIMKEAVTRGISIIMTGGTAADSELIRAAEEKGVCILSSRKDTMTVLNLLSADFDSRRVEKEITDTAREWMGPPLYLYHNDVVADWHRLYRRMFDMLSKCAVVDNKQRICGSVDAMQIVSAELTSRISSLLITDEQCLAMDENTPLSVLAENMITNHTAIAYLTRDGIVTGVITSNDILRYYRLKMLTADTFTRQAAVLEDAGTFEGNKKHIYKVVLPKVIGEEKGCPSGEWISIITEAAAHHGRVLLDGECECEVGSFYLMDMNLNSENLKVSSEAFKQTEDACTLSLELYDDSMLLAKGTVMIRRG